MIIIDLKINLECKQSKFITAAKPNQMSSWMDATISSVYSFSFWIIKGAWKRSKFTGSITQLPDLWPCHDAGSGVPDADSQQMLQNWCLLILINNGPQLYLRLAQITFVQNTDHDKLHQYIAVVQLKYCILIDITKEMNYVQNYL